MPFRRSQTPRRKPANEPTPPTKNAEKSAPEPKAKVKASRESPE